MTQDELKQAVGQAAADYVAAHAPAGCVLASGPPRRPIALSTPSLLSRIASAAR